MDQNKKPLFNKVILVIILFVAILILARNYIYINGQNQMKQALQDLAPNKSEVENIVKDYITNNPELIKAALANSATDKEKNTVNTSVNELNQVAEPVEVFLGNKDAKKSFVEVFDYSCSHCKTFSKDIKNLVAQNENLKVILKPIAMMGDESTNAAKAAIAVFIHYNDKFQNFHIDLCDAQSLDIEFIKKIALTHNIPFEDLQEKMNSKQVQEQLESNMETYKNTGNRGVPATIWGAEVVLGAISPAELNEKISKMS